MTHSKLILVNHINLTSINFLILLDMCKYGNFRRQSYFKCHWKDVICFLWYGKLFHFKHCRSMPELLSLHGKETKGLLLASWPGLMFDCRQMHLFLLLQYSLCYPYQSIRPSLCDKGKETKKGKGRLGGSFLPLNSPPVPSFTFSFTPQTPVAQAGVTLI